MSTTAKIFVREDDTEPLEIVLGAEGLTSLDDVTAAAAYFRKSGAAANHVNGATVTVADSAALTVRLNPVGAKSGGGNAFDTPGTYRGLVKLTRTGGIVTRHPGDPSDDLIVVVGAKLDS